MRSRLGFVAVGVLGRALEIPIDVAPVSDSEQDDGHLSVVHRSEDAVCSYSPAPAVLDALQLLCARQAAWIIACTELVFYEVRNKKKRLSVEFGKLPLRF